MTFAVVSLNTRWVCVCNCIWFVAFVFRVRLVMVAIILHRLSALFGWVGLIGHSTASYRSILPIGTVHRLVIEQNARFAFFFLWRTFFCCFFGRCSGRSLARIQIHLTQLNASAAQSISSVRVRWQKLKWKKAAAAERSPLCVLSTLSHYTFSLCSV